VPETRHALGALPLDVRETAGTTDDPVRVMRSIADAIAAIALWDVLDEANRDELLGPWAALNA